MPNSRIISLYTCPIVKIGDLDNLSCVGENPVLETYLEIFSLFWLRNQINYIRVLSEPYDIAGNSFKMADIAQMLRDKMLMLRVYVDIYKPEH